MIRIGEFRSSESGGKWGEPGDQVMPKDPGKVFDGEVRCRYFDGGFTVLYRPIQARVAESIAYNMEAAARNPYVGYSQNNGAYPRESFYYALEKAGGDAAKINTLCNGDCSSGTAALLKNAGIDVPLNMWTGTAPTILSKTRQFMELDIDPDDANGYYLLRGDILYRPGHMAIVIENGVYMVPIIAKATGDVWQRLLPGVQEGTQLRTIACGDLAEVFLPGVKADGRNWYVTRYNGRLGWTSDRYLEAVKIVEATGSVYIRELPKLGSAILDTLHNGDRVVAADAVYIDHRNIEWFQIVTGERLGWVSGKYSRLMDE